MNDWTIKCQWMLMISWMNNQLLNEWMDEWMPMNERMWMIKIMNEPNNVNEWMYECQWTNIWRMNKQMA